MKDSYADIINLPHHVSKRHRSTAQRVRLQMEEQEKQQADWEC